MALPLILGRSIGSKGRVRRHSSKQIKQGWDPGNKCCHSSSMICSKWTGIISISYVSGGEELGSYIKIYIIFKHLYFKGSTACLSPLSSPAMTSITTYFFSTLDLRIFKDRKYLLFNLLKIIYC